MVAAGGSFANQGFLCNNGGGVWPADGVVFSSQQGLAADLAAAADRCCGCGSYVCDVRAMDALYGAPVSRLGWRPLRSLATLLFDRNDAVRGARPEPVEVIHAFPKLRELCPVAMIDVLTIPSLVADELE